jgi:hypothetical protein
MGSPARKSVGFTANINGSTNRIAPAIIVTSSGALIS